MGQCIVSKWASWASVGRCPRSPGDFIKWKEVSACKALSAGKWSMRSLRRRVRQCFLAHGPGAHTWRRAGSPADPYAHVEEGRDWGCTQSSRLVCAEQVQRPAMHPSTLSVAGGVSCMRCFARTTGVCACVGACMCACLGVWVGLGVRVCVRMCLGVWVSGWVWVKNEKKNYVGSEQTRYVGFRTPKAPTAK